jgi:hypothetical protein
MPSDAAVRDYHEHISSLSRNTAWAGGCRSWYKGNDGDGQVVGVYPGTKMHFVKMLEKFRGEDWEFVYVGENEGRRFRANRFAYLGNGFLGEEVEGLTGFKAG